MIQSVEIKNLRGIREGKLDNLSPLTIFVGPNGCGKSTVLDALHIGAHPVPPEAVGRTVARHKGVNEGARWLAWRADSSRQISVIVNTGDDYRRSCNLSFQQKIPEEVARVLCRTHLRYTGSDPNTLISFYAGNRYDYKPGEYAEIIPDVRFVETYVCEGEPLHQLYARTVEQGRKRQAEAILTDLLPGFKNVEILVEGDTPIIHLVYEDYSVPAALGGDGIHTLLRLVLELASLPRGLVLLEEPEVHQHPASIRQSVRAILSAVRREIQVVFTTHSLELIDVLLAEANDEDLQRLSVYRLNLERGKLLSHRLPGPDVAVARQQIEDDLR